ncbi:hypothetical protein Gpo141_00007683 [Globisporangium polare]
MVSTTIFIDMHEASTTSMMTNTATTVINGAVPVDKRCAYASKVCANPRAIKPNKTLHRLCEFHRRKANLNQQRMQQRRRQVRRHSGQQDSRENNSSNNSSGSAMSIPASSDQIVFLDEFRAPPPLESDFSPEELRALESMLFDSEDGEESEYEAALLDPRRRRRGQSLRQSHASRLRC